MFSLSQAPMLSAFPSVCWDSLLEEELGKQKADSCRQTAQWCCCFLWHDGLALSVAILAKLADWRGRSDLGFCFDFLRLLISEWVGWNPAADVTSREETTRYGYRLSSLLRHARPTLAPTLASVVMVTSPNCLVCLSILILCLLLIVLVVAAFPFSLDSLATHSSQQTIQRWHW